MFRTHSDQLSEHNRNGQFRLEGITRKMEEIGSQIQVDNKMKDTLVIIYRHFLPQMKKKLWPIYSKLINMLGPGQ